MPKQDFNIDELKSTWQQQDISESYQQSDIVVMLNAKSRNYVKYLLWISVLEFLVFTGVLIFSFFSKDDHSSFKTILSRLQIHNEEYVLEKADQFYYIVKTLGLCITGIFVVLFYSSYKRINIRDNMKVFILKILSFKRKVNAFILINIILLIVYILSFSIYLNIILTDQNVHLPQETKIGFIVGILVALLVSIIFILLYYRIIYGIILKRLNKTLSQLRENETENNMI